MGSRPLDHPQQAAGPEEADLWFLPGPADPDEAGGPLDMPLPRAATGGLVDLAEWGAAQAVLAADLAELAQDLGRLQERLLGMGQGAVARLAASEALALGWWAGDRLSTDRLALWTSYRIGRGGWWRTDPHRLGRVAAGGPAVHRGADGGGRGAWSRGAGRSSAGRGGGGRDAGGRGSSGSDTGLRAVPPLAQPGRADRSHARVRSCGDRRHRGGAGGLSFLQLTLTGFGALTAGGPPERLAAWQARAEAETADLSGCTRAPLTCAPTDSLGWLRSIMPRLTCRSRARALVAKDRWRRPSLRSWHAGRGPFLRQLRPPPQPCHQAQRCLRHPPEATASIDGLSSPIGVCQAETCRQQMHAIVGSQFPHCALSLHGLQRHPRLECRVVVPTFQNVLISSCLEMSRLQIAASVTVRFSGGSSVRRGRPTSRRRRRAEW